MASLANNIKKFEPSSSIINNNGENFKTFSQQLEIYLVASGLEKADDKRKIAIMLNSMGESGLAIFNSFNCDTNKITFEQLKSKFIEYFEPKRNLTVTRHKFFTLKQQDTESLDNFIVNLELSSHMCNFGDLRESLVKDILIANMSMNCSNIRQKLLQDPDLTLEKAKTICKTLTMAQINENSISNNITLEKAENIYRINKGKNKFNQKYNKVSSPRQEKIQRRGSCSRCGKVHEYRRCPAWSSYCKACQGYGHFTNLCFSKNKNRNIRNLGRNIADHNDDNAALSSNAISKDEIHSNSDSAIIGNIGSLNLYNINSSKNNESKNCEKTWYINLEINNKNLKCILDTGADINVMPLSMFKWLDLDCNKIQKQICQNFNIRSYSGHTLDYIGLVNLKTKLNSRNTDIKFFIINNNSPTVIGLPTCIENNLIIKNFSVTSTSEMSCHSIVSLYRDVFQGLGCLPSEHNIKLKPGAIPCIEPSRKVPFALMEPLQAELQSLVKLGVLEPVSHPTPWVSNIVITKRKSGQLRICLDPRNLNKNIVREIYPIKNIDEIRSKLSGAAYFSHLDAYSGFHNIKLNKKSTDLCTFQTPFGRYKYLRLPFGICSATEIFYKTMVDLFGDLEGTIVWCDDILVYGDTVETHNKRLKNLFERARSVNLKLNESKCKFLLQEVTYLGYIFSKDGVKIDPEKIRAIKELPEPKNIKELQRFLGMINFLSPFIENMSHETHILRNLLKKNTIWSWDSNCQKSFIKLKEIITKAPVLTNFNSKLPLTLSVDASKNAIGAVLLQNNQPISYSSRALTQTQQNYAQIEKELFAIQFGCTKFHQFIYGIRTIVHTDHKPLVYLFKKSLHDVPARLQRMMLSLQGYDLDVIYVPGKYMYIPDTLSRASLKDTFIPSYEEDLQYHVNSIFFSNLSVTKEYLESLLKATDDDESLKLLKKYHYEGWPISKCKVDSMLKPYWNIQDEIHVMNGLLFKGNRLIIPKSLHKKMLENLHKGHLGINKTQNLARETIYWPNINADIKNLIEQCLACSKFSRSNSKEPLKCHTITTLPWHKVGVDLMYFDGKTYLIVVDYYSKYIEVVSLQNYCADSVIIHLKSIFARHGIPLKLVSDNGPPFSSDRFKAFMQDWDIDHILTSPYLPRSNGQAESSVKIVKNMLRKCKESKSDFFLALLHYRCSPKENFPSPAKLLMSRNLRNNIPALNNIFRPSVICHSKYKQINVKNNFKMSKFFNKHGQRLSTLNPGNKIFFKKEPNSSWTPGTIKKILECGRSYILTDLEGISYRRNRIHIKPRFQDLECSRPSLTSQGEYAGTPNIAPMDCSNVRNDLIINDEAQMVDSDSHVTRSGRNVKTPKLYMYENFN